MKAFKRLFFLTLFVSVLIFSQEVHALGEQFPNPFTDNLTQYPSSSVASKVARPCSMTGAIFGAAVGGSVGGAGGVLAIPFYNFQSPSDISAVFELPLIGVLVGGYAGAVLIGTGMGAACGYPLSFF